jgi:glycosyltransferase involved in cell wall biosynthesis
MRLTYRFASSVIAISQGIKDVLCQLGNFDGRRLKVIHKLATTGAKQHRKLLTVRYNLWACGFKRHILSLGMLKVQKDHQTLIKAFARLHYELDAKLVVLSEGPLRVQLNQLIEQLGLRDSVLFPGFIVDPAAWYISAGLLAYSSRWNGFPLVLIEILAFGLPIVSSDCQSGSAEILENGR